MSSGTISEKSNEKIKGKYKNFDFGPKNAHTR